MTYLTLCQIDELGYEAYNNRPEPTFGNELKQIVSYSLIVLIKILSAISQYLST